MQKSCLSGIFLVKFSTEGPRKIGFPLSESPTNLLPFWVGFDNTYIKEGLKNDSRVIHSNIIVYLMLNKTNIEYDH